MHLLTIYKHHIVCKRKITFYIVVLLMLLIGEFATACRERLKIKNVLTKAWGKRINSTSPRSANYCERMIDYKVVITSKLYFPARPSCLFIFIFWIWGDTQLIMMICTSVCHYIKNIYIRDASISKHETSCMWLLLYSHVLCSTTSMPPAAS